MIRLLLAAAALTVPTTGFAQVPDPVIAQLMQAIPDEPGSDKPDPRRIVGRGIFAHQPPVREAMSEDGRWFGSHDGDGALLVREAEGEPVVVARPEAPFHWTADGARLSGDGRWIAAKMVDDTMVREVSISDEKGGTQTIRYSNAGASIPDKRLFIVSRDGRTRAEIPLRDDYIYIAGFDSDGRGVRYLESDRIGRHVALRHFDMDDGQIETLMEETSDDWTIAGYDLGDYYSFRFEGSNRLVLLDDDRFLWTSDRSGERAIYAYALGAPPRRVPLPADQWLVDFVGIAPDHGTGIVKTTSAKDLWGGETLYAFDTGTLEVRKLIEATHIPLAEMVEGGVFVPETDLPPSLTIHRTGYDGRPLAPPESRDLGFVRDLPVRFEKLVLPGADGTPLRAILVAPTGKGRVPLVDNIYGGPQTREATPDPFGRNVMAGLMLARQGIASVLIDGRGTTEREARFSHAQDGRFGESVIADHASAIRALLARDKALDPKRVGIMGHSWGGYFTLRGMIEANDLYKAGLMMAPNTDTSTMRVPVEAYQGCLPADCPEAYAQGDLTDRLDELCGPLLIIQGQADDDVLPEIADDLAQKLDTAGAEYELVRLPNANHIVQRDPGHVERMIAFWKEQFGL